MPQLPPASKWTRRAVDNRDTHLCSVNLSENMILLCDYAGSLHSSYRSFWWADWRCSARKRRIRRPKSLGTQSLGRWSTITPLTPSGKRRTAKSAMTSCSRSPKRRLSTSSRMPRPRRRRLHAGSVIDPKALLSLPRATAPSATRGAGRRRASRRSFDIGADSSALRFLAGPNESSTWGGIVFE